PLARQESLDFFLVVAENAAVQLIRRLHALVGEKITPHYVPVERKGKQIGGTEHLTIRGTTQTNEALFVDGFLLFVHREQQLLEFACPLLEVRFRSALVGQRLPRVEDRMFPAGNSQVLDQAL